MRKVKDRKGQRFGKLTVIRYLGTHSNRHAIWLCQCDCGKETTVTSNNLISGNVRSCGCSRDNKRQKQSVKEQYPRLYRIWVDMKSRTKYKNKGINKCYREIDISVCEEWKNSFLAFKEWSFKNGYNDFLSIDRIDNSKGYCPENCRWATVKQQNNNQRTNIFITYKDETHTLAEWCDILGLKYSTVHNRIKTLKWDIERAFTTP